MMEPIEYEFLRDRFKDINERFNKVDRDNQAIIVKLDEHKKKTEATAKIVDRHSVYFQGIWLVLGAHASLFTAWLRGWFRVQ